VITKSDDTCRYFIFLLLYLQTPLYCMKTFITRHSAITSVTQGCFVLFHHDGATHCSNGGGVKFGVENSTKAILEYNHSTGAYPLCYFYEILIVCRKLQSGSLIKISEDSPEGFQSYGV